jgi:hypothetical protein
MMMSSTPTVYVSLPAPGNWDRSPPPVAYLVPKYMGLRRELARSLKLHNCDRAHNGRLTKGRTPAEVLGAAKMWR